MSEYQYHRGMAAIRFIESIQAHKKFYREFLSDSDLIRLSEMITSFNVMIDESLSFLNTQKSLSAGYEKNICIRQIEMIKQCRDGLHPPMGSDKEHQLANQAATEAGKNGIPVRDGDGVAK